jgi:hypothetical protein
VKELLEATIALVATAFGSVFDEAKARESLALGAALEDTPKGRPRADMSHTTYPFDLHHGVHPKEIHFAGTSRREEGMEVEE